MITMPLSRRGLTCLRAMTAVFALFGSATSPSHELKTHSLNIPSLPLPAALREFSVQTELNIGMDEATGDSTHKTPPLQGEFSVDHALDVLLSDTRFYATWVDAGAISIRQDHAPSGSDVFHSVVVIGSPVSEDRAAPPAPIRVYSRERIGVATLPEIAALMAAPVRARPEHAADDPDPGDIDTVEPTTADANAAGVEAPAR